MSKKSVKPPPPALLPSEMIWIPDDTSVYELAKIVEDHIVEGGQKDQKVKVETIGKKPTDKTLDRSTCYDVDKSHLIDLDDLIEMNSLHEAPLLDVLRRRWLKDSMYTYTGDFLVSINPYHNIVGQNDNPLKYLDLSVNKDKKKLLSPHVFAIANNALREIVKEDLEEDEKLSQSIIVTGESGAGKTEASKQVMNFLTRTNTENVSFVGADETAELIKNVILDSNSIFEAFGNAKTVRNDNSSRFGKYIKLQYTADNQLWAANTETFLLEKSRLVSVSKDDRNYHIFYQMVRGLDAATKQRLGLTTVDAFKILTEGGCTVITSEQDDIVEFEAVNKALPLMGCTAAEVTRVWELLACALHLGNVVCVAAAADGQPVTLQSPTMPLDKMTSFFGVTQAAFTKALTTQIVKVGKEEHEKALSAEEVKNNINALIKWVYGGLFNWIVSKVNSAHTSLATTQKKETVKFIGILDIFGFEIFVKNTFEQLCINYTNERLQQQFNEIAFEVEQQEYAKEGLNWTSINYRDNQPVIDLIGKKPQGLLIILEEHSLMNREPDDNALLSTFHKLHFNQHPNYAKPRFGSESFVIKHFAGDVDYFIANFISKNNDSLQKDLFDQLAASSDKFLLNILSAGDNSSVHNSSARDTKTKIASAVSVSYRFRSQLDDLMNTLRSTKAFYIKCIKPNGEKKAGVFNAPMVITQLRYSGVLEIVRIRREGYPTRVPYFEFYDEFKELARGKKWVEPSKCSEAQLKEYCKLLCTEYAPKDSFQLGKRFLFLHHYVPHLLHTALHGMRKKWATKIQACFRGHSQYKKYNSKYKSTILIQSLMRMAKAKKVNKQLAEEKKMEIAKEMARLRELERLEMERRKEEERKELERRKEEERLEMERRSEEERQEMMRLKAEKELADKQNKSTTAIQSVFRGHLDRKDVKLDAKLKATRRLQIGARRFLRNLRNRKLILDFHAKCKAGETDKVKSLIVRSDACIYRNKWDKYCTMYQSAASTGQIKLLKDFAVSPKELLEKDIQGSRLLHHAIQNPDLAFIKYLCEVMNEVKTKVVINIREDDDDEDEDPSNIVSPGRISRVDESMTAPANLNAATTGLDVVTGMPIIKAGWLKKSTTMLGFRTWRRRWCVLTEESFVLYKAVNKKPAGYISIEGCTVERAPGKEPVIVIKRPGIFSPQKKGAFGAGTQHSEHDFYTMKADTELIAQEWLTPLKIAAGVRPFRDGPIDHLNLDVRHKWAKMQNSLNQSPLHILAGLPAQTQRAKGDEMVRVAAWLLENGCSIDDQDKDGKTPLQVATSKKNSKVADFLTARKTALTKQDASHKAALATAMSGLAINRDVAARRVSASVLDQQAQQDVYSKNKGVVDPAKLLLGMKSKGFSYLQINFEKLINAAGKTTPLDGLVNPRLWISVCNGKEEPVEVIQEIDAPALVMKDVLWWGYTWHMQTPLENIGENFTVVIRFLYGAAAADGPLSTSPTARFLINKETIDTSPATFLFTAPAPVANALHSSTAPGKKGAAVAVPDVPDSILEGDIVITKFFRVVDLDKIANS